jgi:plasmid maintenance system killer protein
MAGAPEKVEERKERERLVKEFDRILAKLKAAKNREKFETAASELYDALEMDSSIGNLERVEYLRMGLIMDLDDNLGNEEVLSNPDRRREARLNLIRMIQRLIDMLNAMSGVKDMSNVMGTEKEFLSEKVPKEIAEQHIAPFLTGKKGSLGAQASQLKVDMGKSGVPSKGGRTKKNRSSKRKTRGRR